MNQTISKIRSFIFENFLFDADESALGNNDSFLEQGIIDSTGILELVDWLEETFTIKVLDEELIPENLDSVTKLADFIGKKSC
ncbi:MAG: acyl carrier protein [Desulfobulbaceae bacterium]|nr:acyl carrier protein [Pseudomonadota bacterium]MCG2746196.1 acyl carrier protein [Desulfobulbaceae bacterium]